MSGPYHARDLFDSPKDYQPLICQDPENCQEHHNEEDPMNPDELHHYGCECGWCSYLMWTLKG